MQLKRFTSTLTMVFLFTFIFANTIAVFAANNVEDMDPELLKKISKYITIRYYRDTLLEADPEAPTNPTRPDDTSVSLNATLWQGDETKAWSEELAKKVEAAVKTHFEKVRKLIDNSLKSCYKSLDTASKKAKKTEQDKAMALAISALNQSYKKIIGELPTNLNKLLNDTLKAYAKTDKDYANAKFATELTVSGVFLPPAPGGILNKLFSSSSDRSKQHKSALAQIPGFKLEKVENDPAFFTSYVPVMWGQSAYPFVISDERICFGINLPIDLESEMFSNIFEEIRKLLLSETKKFDTEKVRPLNEQMRAIVCDPKKTIENFHKVTLSKEQAIHKDHIAFKGKIPDAIDKIVHDILATLPAYKGSPKLRNFGVAREDMTFAMAFGDSSQMRINDQFPIFRPSLELFDIKLAKLKAAIEELPGQVKTSYEKTTAFIASAKELISSIEKIEDFQTMKITFADKSIFSEFNAAYCDAYKSLETPIEKIRTMIVEIESFLAAVEKKAGTDKSVMTQVNGAREVISFLQEPLRELEKVRLVASEQSNIFNSAPMYTGPNLKSFLVLSIQAMVKSMQSMVDAPINTDFSAIKSAVSAMLENIKSLEI